MNNTEVISWKVFKNTLLQHQDLDLRFKYAESKFVDAAYHITEIKQAPITSVDCGGKMNNWTEIIMQLWVPDGRQQERSMKVAKALSIIDLVEKMMPLDPGATVKIEFGNSGYDTRQMFPNTLHTDSESLIIDLRPDFVQCKATSRSESCGTDKANDKCCSVAEACC